MPLARQLALPLVVTLNQQQIGQKTRKYLASKRIAAGAVQYTNVGKEDFHQKPVSGSAELVADKLPASIGRSRVEKAEFPSS